ncbi:hypothetical protein SAMN05192561_103122 [Halopenitus malekzadehii]|uniref:Uncharacterized protein n=1 Tax=Halopenitus malekzadehii TaxID=1267564 RepID=A0A1H6IK01_9EURY|nr:hypothetical protein SAMN05192561_103122 [Halopenitus malekzadehii]
MSYSRSRRSALQLVGITACGLAGCLSSSGSDGKTPSSADGTASETQSPTSTLDQQIQNLSFNAEMLSQQSADTPARFEATLANRGPEAITTGMGPALMISDTGSEENPTWADKLIIDPDTDVGPWSDPVQTGDDCWRFPEDGTRSIQSILKYNTIDPSDNITERYSVYTAATVSACLPAGRYTYQNIADVYPDGRGADPAPRSIVLTIHIDSTQSQQLSVSAESPELQTQ